MILHAYCSEFHYANKLVPIWNALPTELKGEFVLHPRLDGLVQGARIGSPNQDGVMLVASHKDSQWAKHKFIYVEHGAGQSYAPQQWYSNAHRNNMLAALVPGPYCAAKTMQANPNVPVLMIGAPHLKNVTRTEPNAIAFAWHWRCSVSLEAGTAFDEYAEAMVQVASVRKVIGTGHPRIFGEVNEVYKQCGIESVERSGDVLERAAILVVDNSSIMYEAAALDIPVVLMNSQNYRKDREWGLRFWEALPGPQVDSPAELLPMLELMIAGGYQEWAERRQGVTTYVYGEDPFGSLPAAVAQLEEIVSEYASSI